MRVAALFILITLSSVTYGSETPNGSGDSLNAKRLGIVVVGSGLVYGASIVALNQAWYKEQKSSFHFFNDNAQWNQVDKVGHSFSAYQLARAGSEMFKWTEMPDAKAAIWGSVLSQAFMLPIEIFDGHAAEYGFSWGDVAANLAGTSLFLSQELIFKEQKVKLKLSIHQTEYAALRPEVLGNGFAERLLKDYNGQTYWLSFDLYALTNKNTKIPKWLNLALGYGAEGMVHGRETQNNAEGYDSYRQYYLGIDFDFSHVKSKNSIVKTLLFVADMVKLPAPALELDKNSKINYHWFYY
ncbi:MAG: DUF2279 domain-containing protein [Cyclobacteriaceae bacterium]|nr:DUF2279 domain-containing protein [Cyclobacteriaceae bacterium]